MPELPSTVVLPQPLTIPAGDAEVLERRPVLPRTTCKRFACTLSEPEGRHLQQLAKRFRLSVAELLRSLVNGVPLPPPLPRRRRPLPSDVEVARALMLLREALVRSTRLLADQRGVPGQDQVNAAARLEQHLASMLPVIDAMGRRLLDGGGHE